MNYFSPLQKLILEKLTGAKRTAAFYGVEESQWIFIQEQMESLSSAPRQLFLFDSQEKAEYYHEKLNVKLASEILLYPGIDASPYKGHLLSDCSLFERFRALSSLVSPQHFLKKTIIFSLLGCSGPLCP